MTGFAAKGGKIVFSDLDNTSWQCHCERQPGKEMLRFHSLNL
ncbi:hypothetical protein [Enterobacter bugandensis]|nr:hypothetical protein [Enterobacter bugandensis]